MRGMWRENGVDPKPPQHVWVQVMLKTHQVIAGFFVKDINKYIRNVNRWKDVSTGKWHDDSEVMAWMPFTEGCAASK